MSTQGQRSLCKLASCVRPLIINVMSNENTDMCWSGGGWTAEVVQSEDGGGWALAMTHDSHDEPTMVVPWVMGRNKKDPKPLNKLDYAAAVKAAQDFLNRHEQQRRMAHRVSFDVVGDDGGWVRVVFDIIPDEYETEGELVGFSRAGDELARVSCPTSLKLTREVALKWVNEGFNPIYEA